MESGRLIGKVILEVSRRSDVRSASSVPLPVLASILLVRRATAGEVEHAPVENEQSSLRATHHRRDFVDGAIGPTVTSTA
jgi:hypothetical protein